jgi:hypothetical protein
LNRLVDPGAVFAGWVGLGVAVVVVLAFGLIIPVQALVLVSAPVIGLVVGAYANSRAERWRPRLRAFANASYAALVAGVSLALLYVLVRAVFIYGDAGSLPNGKGLECQPGPACVYARYVAEGRTSELVALGIRNEAEFATAIQGELVMVGATLAILTVAAGAVAGTWRAIASVPSARQGTRDAGAVTS